MTNAPNNANNNAMIIYQLVPDRFAQGATTSAVFSNMPWKGTPGTSKVKISEEFF